MGEKLVRIFEILTEQTGFRGRLALANKTGISMTQAAEMNDTDVLVKKIEAAAIDVIDNNS
ncbi:MAG TPA: hypothetical protein DDY17_03840 [Syntrophaceae bacterium]|jgi:hypothetical protein|nr:hypothetical protein [Syntrophaceae bacterium]